MIFFVLVLTFTAYTACLKITFKTEQPWQIGQSYQIAFSFKKSKVFEPDYNFNGILLEPASYQNGKFVKDTSRLNESIDLNLKTAIKPDSDGLVVIPVLINDQFKPGIYRLTVYTDNGKFFLSSQNGTIFVSDGAPKFVSSYGQIKQEFSPAYKKLPQLSGYGSRDEQNQQSQNLPLSSGYGPKVDFPTAENLPKPSDYDSYNQQTQQSQDLPQPSSYGPKVDFSKGVNLPRPSSYGAYNKQQKQSDNLPQPSSYGAVADFPKGENLPRPSSYGAYNKQQNQYDGLPRPSSYGPIADFPKGENLPKPSSYGFYNDQQNQYDVLPQPSSYGPALGFPTGSNLPEPSDYDSFVEKQSKTNDLQEPAGYGNLANQSSLQPAQQPSEEELKSEDSADSFAFGNPGTDESVKPKVSSPSVNFSFQSFNTILSPSHPFTSPFATVQTESDSMFRSGYLTRKTEYFERYFFGTKEIHGSPPFSTELASLFDENTNLPKSEQHDAVVGPDGGLVYIKDSLMSLNGQNHLDEEVIWTTLNAWYGQVANENVKHQVAFINPAYLKGVDEKNLDFVLKLNRKNLEKRYFVIPFEKGPRSYWYLIVYDQFLKELYIVDSRLSSGFIESYSKSVCVFSYILSNYVGFDMGVACDVTLSKTSNGYHLECPKLDYVSFKPDVYYWQGSTKQEDNYNDGILALLNAIEVAKDATILESIKNRTYVSPKSFSAEDLKSARKALFVNLASMYYS